MRTLAKCAIVLPVVYLTAWTTAYVAIAGLEFSYYFEYLRWAWTFRGGELPTYIFCLSFLLFLPLAVASLFLLRRTSTHMNNRGRESSQRFMKYRALFCSLALCSLTGCASVHTPAVAARSGPLVGDEQRLQGSWKVTHNELMHIDTPWLLGRVHIYFGRRFRLDTDTGSEEFRIDEQSEPKRIDFDDGRRPLIKGIYKLEGDRLTVCTGAPGDPRPSNFATSYLNKSILTILVRLPPSE